MRPRKPFPPGSADALHALLKQAERAEDARRIQAVLIRAVDDLPPERIATLVGLSVATVRTLHSQFLRQGVACLIDRPGRGGSRRRVVGDDIERQILVDFIERSKTGGVLNVSDIRAAIEAKVGHRVAPSTVYRLMTRNGWRKVAPRPHHPNRDPAAVEPFKKSLRKSRRKNAKR